MTTILKVNSASNVTNLIIYYTHSHNTAIFSMCNIQFRWAQLHVSALCIGHHPVVFRLVEQLYNKRGILGGVRSGGTRSRPTTPYLLYCCSKSLRTTWWWPIQRAETCSCAQRNCILLTENIVVLWLCIIHNKICCWITTTGPTHVKAAPSVCDSYICNTQNRCTSHIVAISTMGNLA